MAIHAEFSRRSLQSMARLAAYVLLFEYLLNGAINALPPTAQPERLFGQIGGLLDTASLPVLAVVLLYGGLNVGVRPARWEWRLARLMRPLLGIGAALFLLLVPAVWGLGASIQASGNAVLRQQAAQVEQQLGGYRNALSAVGDAAQLRKLIGAQPQLQPVLSSPESPFANPNAAFPQQREQALKLVDRVLANLKAESLARRAAAAGDLRKQQMRMSAMALAHAVFFALACMVWPDGLSSLPPGMEAIDDLEGPKDA